MDRQRLGEGFNRREQPLLQASDQQAGSTLRAPSLPRQSLLTEGAILVEQRGDTKLRGVGWQSRNIDLHNMALRKSANDLTQVILEAAHHYVIQVALHDLD